MYRIARIFKVVNTVFRAIRESPIQKENGRIISARTQNYYIFIHNTNSYPNTEYTDDGGYEIYTRN